jgi:hypothetical protein
MRSTTRSQRLKIRWIMEKGMMKKTKTIGALVTLALLLLATPGAMGRSGGEGLSTNEIVGRAWKAMFGERSRDSIRSICAEGYFHGATVPNRQTVRRPNLFRNETRAGVLVFDGKRAAWASRTPDDKGNPRGPELIEAKYWRHFEVDIAIVFPAFFDHPTELRGIEAVNGSEAYKLFVSLPLGGNVTYFVDAGSFLVTKRLVDWDGNGEEWENRIENHLDYGGIRYPDGYSYPGREGTEKGFYKNVRFNVEAPDELFRVPEGLMP